MKKYTCCDTACRSKFDEFEPLRRHLREKHHLTLNHRVACDAQGCSQTFCSAASQKDHLNRVHRSYPRGPIPKNFRRPPPDDSEEEEK